ncbi:MAG: hypothetical protein ACLSEY_14810 [Enterocloster sp.]
MMELIADKLSVNDLCFTANKRIGRYIGRLLKKINGAKLHEDIILIRLSGERQTTDIKNYRESS